MKALSLWQPWASLIADGRKKIETRSWKTLYRGELAIHASAGNLDRDMALEFGYVWKDLPLGAVLCVVDLFDCHIMTDKWIETVEREDPFEYSAGHYEPGRYAWHLRVTRVLPKPILAKGKQMLWKWNDES